jgi:hypothetical protein
MESNNLSGTSKEWLGDGRRKESEIITARGIILREDGKRSEYTKSSMFINVREGNAFCI